MERVLAEHHNNAASGRLSRSGVITAFSGMGVEGDVEPADSGRVIAGRLGRRIAEALLQSHRRPPDETNYYTWRVQTNTKRRRSGTEIPPPQEPFTNLEDLYTKAFNKTLPITRRLEYHNTWRYLRDFLRGELFKAVDLVLSQPLSASSTLMHPPATSSSPPTISGNLSNSTLPNGRELNSEISELGVARLNQQEGDQASQHNTTLPQLLEEVGREPGPMQGLMYIWSFAGDTGIHVKVGYAQDPVKLSYRCANLNGYQWNPEQLLIYNFRNIPAGFNIKHVEILFGDLASCRSHQTFNHGVWCGDETAIEEGKRVLELLRNALNPHAPPGDSANAMVAAPPGRAPGFSNKAIAAARDLPLQDVTSTAARQFKPRHLNNPKAELYLK
jgi:hypothetical protein